MKKLHIGGSFVRGLAVGLAVFACVSVAKAIPFASGVIPVTLGGSNYIQFVLNESNATVNVVFEDNTTNSMGTIVNPGKTNFYLGAHTSYQIICSKVDTGTPVKITSDTNPNGFNLWPNPRGLDINKNPTNGSLFGRIYIGNCLTGTENLGAGTTTKYVGIYALNADCSDSYLGKGTNASNPGGVFTGGTGTGAYNSPQKLSINPNDNTIDVADNSTASANVYKLTPDLSSSTTLFTGIGQTAGLTAGTHVSPEGIFTTGSIATGDLVVYSADADLPAPSSGTTLGTGGNGPTAPGSYNCVYMYNIGAGPLPWTHQPDVGTSICLPTFGGSIYQIRLDATLGPDPNKIYACCYRLNYSDGTVQVLDRTTGNLLFTSLTPGGTDVFNPTGGNAPYFQVRVSPDGKFLAAFRNDSTICVVALTNGIPDTSSLFVIQNPPVASNARGGLAFDAADNIYVASYAQGTMSGYSLGISATTIYSNDASGLNGSFSVQLPPAAASVVASTPQASQNYINNAVPGTPIPGVFTVSLGTGSLPGPVVVNISLTGTAVYGATNNYTINSTDANGVIYTTNSITFPAGSPSGGGNWVANLIVTPTATPVSGPTLTVNMKVLGGATYQTQPPLAATVTIQNTGPQLLVLSSAGKGGTMNRGIAGDYAEYIITRLGDTNGPGNSPGSINPLAYTVTNFIFSGTSAGNPTDYTAPPQRVDPANNGVAVSPTNGVVGGIVIYPGNTAVTAVIGNPVRHTNLTLPPTNVTIGINITNTTAPFTNELSSEGLAYSVTTAGVTVTEVDNTVGPEVVIWSDPLTNPSENTWTLTYANTNLASYTVLPVVIPNYANGQTEIVTGGPSGTNDFEVTFGNPVANDSVPQSPVMAANGWTTALKMTVNKDGNGSPCAVNLYPPGQNFLGNVALRFSMYLSLVDADHGTTANGSNGREFAIFGMDHIGTNANWRPSLTPVGNTGAGVTNWDGQWFAVDAAPGSLTPSDFDSFNSPALPNGSLTDADIQSNPSSAETGVFKNPPFTADELVSGGNPANQWVEVDVEKMQTTTNGMFNMNMFIDRASMVSTFQNTAGIWTNGTIMLGYEDPLADVSDSTAFVYYSNVRVVELAPFINAQPVSVLALKGANVSFTTSATYATAPITNKWFLGNTAPAGSALQTDTAAGTNITSVLNLSNVQTGTNYFGVASDTAGSITSVAASLEVIAGPANVSASLGAAKATFTVTPTGQSAPTAYQWKTNGVALVNGTKYANVTTASMNVSNITVADGSVLYSCSVTNAAGSVTTAGATLTVVSPPTSAVVSPASSNALWGSSVTFTVSASGTAPFTYGWMKGATLLSNGGNISGAKTASLTIANITGADAASYTANVTNSAGHTTSSAGVLTISRPPPSFSSTAVSGGNVSLSFSSPNNFDTTGAFILQSSPVATGPYTNTPGTFTGSSGSFQVTSPQPTNSSMFYRLLHSN